MSVKEQGKKSGLNKSVVWFFVFAIAIVAAFLIVGLVKTCTAEHEEDQLEKEIMQENALGYIPGDNFIG